MNRCVDGGQNERATLSARPQAGSCKDAPRATMRWQDIALFSGKSVDAETGLLVADGACCVNWEPVRLGAGSAIAPKPGFECRIWTYADGFEESLVRSYSYDAESNWTTIRRDLVRDEWAMCRTVVPETCYVRIGVRQRYGNRVAMRTLADAVDIEQAPLVDEPLPAWFQAEADRVVSRVDALRGPDDLTFMLLSDIHYSTGCVWPQTARNVQEVAARVNPQGVVQLGDVTDGIAPAPVTVSFVERVLGDLARCGVPLYGCIGNHDVNYFKGNAQRLSDAACAELYLGRQTPWFYEDFPAQRVRCLFLHSFDPEEQERYGYPLEEVFWAQRALLQTPRDWKVVVFSHVTPAAEIHYWSDTIRNGEMLLRMLARFDAHRGGAILGLVHGHSHVDQVYRRADVPFPLISVGCAKFEDFEECKPAGSTTPKRAQDTATQDLWDVLVVKPDANRLEFVRFGAGTDRSVGKHG